MNTTSIFEVGGLLSSMSARGVEKHLARLNIIKDLLSRLHYADKDERLILPDPDVVFHVRRNVFEKRHD